MQLHERIRMIEAVEESQTAQRVDLARELMNMMSIDESDAVYQSCRSMTTTGLAVGSLIAGGYGAVKGVIGFNKLARMPIQMAKLSPQIGHRAEGVLKVGKFTYSNTAARHFTESVKHGPNAGRLSRPYMNSPLTINEIMAAGKPIPDPRGMPGGLRWDVSGTFRGSEGIWELVVNPETEVIVHFNFK
jgi:hypothetical protein